MPEPLNLPQPEVLLTSGAELEVMPARVQEVEAAADLAGEVLAEVVPIGVAADEAFGEAPAQPADEAPDQALETAPVAVTAEGEPVDMARYRRVQAARQAVDEARAGAPEPPQIGELAA